MMNSFVVDAERQLGPRSARRASREEQQRQQQQRPRRRQGLKRESAEGQKGPTAASGAAGCHLSSRAQIPPAAAEAATLKPPGSSRADPLLRRLARACQAMAEPLRITILKRPLAGLAPAARDPDGAPMATPVAFRLSHSAGISTLSA